MKKEDLRVRCLVVELDWVFIGYWIDLPSWVESKGHKFEDVHIAMLEVYSN